MQQAFQFVQDNWAVIATVLLGLSELLGNIPAVKANSIFQLLTGLLKKEAEKKEK